MNYEGITVRQESTRVYRGIAEVLGSAAVENQCVFSPEESGLYQMPQTD